VVAEKYEISRILNFVVLAFLSDKSTVNLQFVGYLNSWLACSHEIHENWYPTNNNESTVCIYENGRLQNFFGISC